jgi:hypothetical protein
MMLTCSLASRSLSCNGGSFTGRITAPALSLVGGESDPAFFEIEELLRGLPPQLETTRVPGVGDSISAIACAARLRELGINVQPVVYPAAISVA